MEETVALINRAQAGDAEAYGVLVSRFQDMAYGYTCAVRYVRGATVDGPYFL